MKAGIIYAVGAVIAVAGIGAAVRPVRQRAHQIAADLKIISADTGDVMSSAVYQRFARRREAVASMRTALLQVAAIESTFVADSGRPTTSLFGRYVPKDQRLLGPAIEIQRDRWVAKVSHQNATMSCSLTAMVDPTTLDSTTWRYHAGEPVCLGWTAESTALANAPVPINNAPVPTNPVPPESPPEPLRAPRRHRDWGPVNNTPPPVPWVIKNECPGEYCSFGRWAACSALVARREKRAQAPPALTLQPGDEFTAVTGDVHVDVPGMVVFRHPYSNPGDEGGPPVDSIRFSPADTLYVLNGLSEGYLMWYYRGRADIGYQFWIGPPFIPGEAEPGDTAIMIRPPHEVWWVRVRNAAGREGWVQYDHHKMARDDRMDERSRCLR